jgi:hypothetical protein
MDPTYVFKAQLHSMLRIPGHQPSETLAQTNHSQTAVHRFDCGRRDNSVDTRRRSAAHQNRQGLPAVVPHSHRRASWLIAKTKSNIN